MRQGRVTRGLARIYERQSTSSISAVRRKLVVAAEKVRAADREFRSYLRSEQAAPSDMPQDYAPAELQLASDRSEDEVKRFAVVARNTIT
jgi:hypothetical protein